MEPTTIRITQQKKIATLRSVSPFAVVYWSWLTSIKSTGPESSVRVRQHAERDFPMKRTPDQSAEDQLRPEYDFSKLRPAARSKYPRYVMVRTVSSKGQITLPAEVREKMRLAPGSEVTFEITQDGTLIRKSPSRK